MNLRVNEQCEFNDVEEFSRFLDEGYTFDVGNDLFRIGPPKLVTDGSLGARSAAMSKPYHDAQDTTGIMNYSVEEMQTFVQLANQFNMPTIAHCIGDRAVDDVLEAYAGNVYEGNPLHHGIVHCQILRQDQIDQIIQKKLSCYFQSIFLSTDAAIVENRVGEALAKTSYPYKTLYENTIASNGSDAPVEMPNALLGAEQLFMQDRIGKIAPDYYADLVVLDTDITKVEANQIHEAKVMMTFMNGEVVFER